MKFFALLSVLLTAHAFADDLLPTLMNTRGKLLVDQAMDKQPPPFDGKSNGFASGFKGWRYNAAERGGHWEVADGAFKGAENPAVLREIPRLSADLVAQPLHCGKEEALEVRSLVGVALHTHRLTG